MSESSRERLQLEISRAAVRLFRSRGIAATTGEQIAEAAGISVRTLWRYFRTKEACAEPLLAMTVDAYVAALRRWTGEVSLADHLRRTYQLPPDVAVDDGLLVSDLVRMAVTDPGLRAVWLVVHDRAEPVLAAVLAQRFGLDPGALEIRVRAAAINAAQRLAHEEMAVSIGRPIALVPHRERLARAVGSVFEGIVTSTVPKEPG
ncbi:TetR family transcriptional regulator [Amycolatopsis sp. NBRC 101858]|uniref:TetR/AcrR family transcriptional regulator n=1 Tax=Amycolatopsis sp. NBRC 101858 TaxID=3032200 RepID=UPI0024A4BBB1|nr:TetR/AcrR family transcriptional regulator [Amycolatopsis sp. NBRC 101858]GLY38934.1 TetR family transcriptional regulator [Amycolatopsis sp. NBRC 101858]